MQRSLASPLPDRVGHYDVFYNRELGRGTYGSVCVGKNIHDNIHVAVKRITPRRESEIYDMKYIDGELRTLQSINHPNVIKLLQYERIAPRTFFIQELCDNDLQRFAQEHTVFQTLKLQFTEEFAAAVRCLHGHEIIHRDIKPENILVKSSEGTWITKMSDFGLSRRIPEGIGSASFSATGGVGTWGWMAPEVIPTDGHARYSKPTDMYSLGVTQLVCGRPQARRTTVASYRCVYSYTVNPLYLANLSFLT